MSLFIRELRKSHWNIIQTVEHADKLCSFSYRHLSFSFKIWKNKKRKKKHCETDEFCCFCFCFVQFLDKCKQDDKNIYYSQKIYSVKSYITHSIFICDAPISIYMKTRYFSYCWITKRPFDQRIEKKKLTMDSGTFFPRDTRNRLLYINRINWEPWMYSTPSVGYG